MSKDYRAVFQMFIDDYTEYRRLLIKEKKAKQTQKYVVKSRFGNYVTSDKWTYSISTLPLKEMTLMNRTLGIHKVNSSKL